MPDNTVLVRRLRGSMAHTKLQDLNLSNAFLFAAALSDPETCRIVLQILLGKPIGSVAVNAEHSLLFSSDCRSIRLDIYADDVDGTHYNVEMQGENEGNLPERSRFHQAEMDALKLEPGEDFCLLEPNYVIFICCFDPFQKGLFRYTFTNRCQETDMALGDGTCKVFFNTKGRNVADVSHTLVNFLKYVENSTDECADALEDDAIKCIHTRVKHIKQSRDWRRKYMKFEELLRKEYKQGRESGAIDGENRMHTLISKMLENGEADKIPMLSDKVFLAEMYRKYNL